jgi:hypothetical protein
VCAALASMGDRRANRGPRARSDREILSHGDDVYLLSEIAHGRLRVTAETRATLRRLAREDLCVAGFGLSRTPTLLPRETRILAAAHGELVLAAEGEWQTSPGRWGLWTIARLLCSKRRSAANPRHWVILGRSVLEWLRDVGACGRNHAYVARSWARTETFAPRTGVRKQRLRGRTARA